MRPILLYLVLVGLPVLGTLGLLQVGQNLVAPISLAGKWSAQLTPPNPCGLSDEVSLLPAGPTTLSITQSGPNLLISFEDDSKSTFAGNIREVIIDAGMVSQHATAIHTSKGTVAIYFHARVDRQSEPDRLLGALILDNGSLRTEVPLTAIRQSAVHRTTGGG